MVSTAFVFVSTLAASDPTVEYVVMQGLVLNNPETHGEPKKGEPLSSWLRAGWKLKGVSGWSNHGAVFHLEHDKR
ncbi:MAG TPA: hypothetical protein VII08_10880 [Myxococcales bacterium]